MEGGKEDHLQTRKNEVSLVNSTIGLKNGLDKLTKETTSRRSIKKKTYSKARKYLITTYRIIEGRRDTFLINKATYNSFNISSIKKLQGWLVEYIS